MTGVVMAWCLWGLSADGGLWQGPPASAPRQQVGSAAASSRPQGPEGRPPADSPGARDWLIVDTGGSGGGFGQGRPHQHLQDVHFWDRRNGVAIGYSGLFRTTDGGLTWQERPLGPVVSADGKDKGTNWYAVRLAGPREIWAFGQIHPGGLGRTSLRRSLDDGFTWTEVLPGRLGHATKLCFGGPLERWVICRWPQSFHSADGGATWQVVRWPLADFVPRDMALPGDVCPPEGPIGYVVGHTRDERSVILKTADGGRTWQVVTPSDAPTGTFACSFPSSWRGWVLGRDGMLATADAGRTWQRLPAPAQAVAIRFFQTGHGWAVGGGRFVQGRLESDHSLWATADGGGTWQPVLGGWKALRSIWSLGPGTAWAVGSAVGFVPNDLVAIYDPGR